MNELRAASQRQQIGEQILLLLRRQVGAIEVPGIAVADQRRVEAEALRRRCRGIA